MRRVNGRILIAGMIAIVGVVGAWRAFHRSASVPVPTSRQTEGLTPTVGLQFEHLESRESIDAYTAEFARAMEADIDDALAGAEHRLDRTRRGDDFLRCLLLALHQKSLMTLRR